jgi:hypothetical protein
MFKPSLSWRPNGADSVVMFQLDKLMDGIPRKNTKLKICLIGHHVAVWIEPVYTKLKLEYASFKPY